MQCLGYYEYEGKGYPGGVTDSYNAKYYGIYPDEDQYEFNINVKVDWTLTGRTSDKTKLDLKIYVSNKDYENWRATFSPDAERATEKFVLESYLMDGEQYYDVNTVGGENVAYANGDSADDEITSWLTDYINTYRPSGSPSGWKAIDNIKIESGSKKHTLSVYESGRPDNFDITSDTYVNWKLKPDDPTTSVAELTIKFLAPKTNDFQVYARYFNAERPNNITLKVNKTIKNESNYSSNFFNLPEYNLNGTKFYLYESETGGSPITQADGSEAVLTITGNKGGNSNEVKLSASYANQTIYLEEILPDTATGFKRPTERIAVTLPAAGKSHTEPISNEPIADPVMLRIKKVSNLTSDGKPIADIDYSGIKYTLSYFGESTSAQANAYANTSAKNTWVFATKEQGEFGQIDFKNESYKVSGPDLYKVNGQPRYPVDWYRIQENPDQTEFLHNKGLELSKDIYYVHIFINDANENDFEIYKGNELYNNPIQGSNPNIAETREGDIYELEHWEPFAFVKKDIGLTSGKPQGDTKLEGAEFTVYSEDSNRFGAGTTYNGHTYSIVNNAVVVDGTILTIKIDANGQGICKYPLPKTDNTSGKRFYIKETKAPDGYKANEVKYYVDFQNTVTIKDYNNNTVSLTFNNADGTTKNTTEIYSITYDSATITVNEDSRSYEKGTAYNTPRKGIIEIEKFDSESDDSKAQGDSSLADIKFAIVNRSSQQVHYNNNDISTGEVVTIISTDSSGKAKASGLPYATYDVYELGTGHSLSAGVTYSDAKAGSKIYANSSYSFDDTDSPDRHIDTVDLGDAVIHPDDDTNTSCLLHYDVYNPVVRADIKVEKTDTEMTDVQGDASLAGIRYAIVNSSKKPIIIGSHTYEIGEVVYIIETDESGVATTPVENSLPYGTYDIYELRLDSGVEERYSYEDADKGTSIYANDYGYLFTESTAVAKNTTSTYDVDKRTEKLRAYHREYTAEFTNVVSNGKLTVQKFDDDAHEEQGDTSFNEINFAVVNRSDHPVYYENKKCGVNTIVAVHKTKTVDGVNGIAVFENLPYGRYQVYELGRGASITPNTPYPDDSTNSSLGDKFYANDSYMLKNPGNPERQVSDILTIHPSDTERDVLVTTEIANTPARGTITVNKYDKETQGTKYNGSYQGNADFEGIRYAIVNRSQKFVKMPDTICYEPGKVVGIIRIILIKCYLYFVENQK